MASFVLFVWPAISIALFAWLGRERGLIWSVVIGYLFLPERLTFPLPGLPDYEKFFAISLGLVVGAFLFRHKRSFDFELQAAPVRDLGADIVEIWKDQLGMDTVPRNTGFRELGGTARQARSAVRQMAAAGMPMEKARLLYDNATIADLAKIVPDDGPTRIGDRGLGVALYIILGLFVFSSVMTVQTNPESLVNGPVVRPGLTYRDLISMVSGPLILMVPFFLALRFLRSRSHQEEVLKAIVVVGVFYAALAAFEVRMSPQLNLWIYGYFPHSWIQHLRDGFRPVVFLRHGLVLGFFLLTAAFAAFTLYRQLDDPWARFASLLAGLWILLVLFLSRNLGAAMLAVVFLPIILFAPRFIQVSAAAVCALLLLAYPIVWQSGFLPKDQFVEFVSTISADRAQSLQFRLDNEAEMLERSLEKPVFGWGAWSRWRVFNQQGEDLTIADGIWVITLGERGWVGYLCFFGLITLPVFYLLRATRSKGGAQVVAGMAVIMAANFIYMIPNSTLTPIGWLLLGTMAGYSRWHVIEVDPVDLKTTAHERSFSPYTRFPQVHSRGQ